MTQNEWVPLKFYTRSLHMTNWPDSTWSIPITRGVVNETINIRGYTIPFNYSEALFMTHEVKFCDKGLYSMGIEVRWLQTSSFDTPATLKDSWYLDDINITFNDGNYSKQCLYDDFNNNITRYTHPIIGC